MPGFWLTQRTTSSLRSNFGPKGRTDAESAFIKPEFWTLLKLQDFMSQAVHLKELTVTHSRPLMDVEEEMLYSLRERGVNVDIRSDEIVY